MASTNPRVILLPDVDACLGFSIWRMKLWDYIWPQSLALIFLSHKPRQEPAMWPHHSRASLGHKPLSGGECKRSTTRGLKVKAALMSPITGVLSELQIPEAQHTSPAKADKLLLHNEFTLWRMIYFASYSAWRWWKWNLKLYVGRALKREIENPTGE